MTRQTKVAGQHQASEVGAEVQLRESSGQSSQWLLIIMLALPLVFLAVFFAYPMIDIFLRSLGGPDQLFTSEHFHRVMGRSIYRRLFWTTFEIAFSVSVVTLFVAYPLAYFLATASRRVASLLILFVLIPFFTSVLVRTYAWMVILSPQGLLNQFLRLFGVGPVTLLYNRAGVLLGMAYTLLPYMVLTLYSVMRGIDRRLLQAAQILGAPGWQTFRRIFLPLTFPGVAGGFLLVFILALGYFITPSLMGGPRDQMIAMVIYQEVGMTLNWKFASALAVILLTATLLGFALYNRVIGLRTLLESKPS